MKCISHILCYIFPLTNWLLLEIMPAIGVIIWTEWSNYYEGSNLYISINAMGFSFAPTNFLLLYNLKKNINCSLSQDRQVMFFPSILQIVLLYPGSDIFILYARYNTSECSAMRILYQSLLLPHALRNSRSRDRANLFNRMLNRSAAHFRDGKKSIVQRTLSNCRLASFSGSRELEIASCP